MLIWGQIERHSAIIRLEDIGSSANKKSQRGKRVSEKKYKVKHWERRR